MSGSESTIGNDVLGADNDGMDAFLASFGGEDPKRETSTEGDDKGDDHGSTETETETETEGDEPQTEETTEEPEGEPDPEDQEVEIKVGEELKKAKLKDLKRLYGQEASLTQKSQKLAESQRQADARFQMANASLTKQLEKAQAHFDQYVGTDFFHLTALLATGQIDQTTFDGIRGDYAAAESQVKFLKEELGTLMQEQQRVDNAAYQQAAAECVKALEHPETGLKGFGMEMYQELSNFAEKQGIPKQAFLKVTDPAQIKLVHMAMQWEKAEAARKAAEAKVKAAPNKPSKVLRPGSSKAAGQGQSAEAMKQLRRSGSVEDAEAAFMASFR